MPEDKKVDILKDFFSISTWQSLVIILIFLVLVVSLGILVKLTKMRFSFRIFTAIGGGVIFAIGIQAILGFPNDDSPTSIWKEFLEDKKTENPNYNLWLHQVITWITLLKTIFINGMLMLSVPVVFLAIARVVAKPHTSGLATMTIKGIIILLINVAVAYTVTYLVGMVLDIGSGLNLQPEGMRDETTVKELPEVISNYMPANFIGAFVGGAIIPVMVIAALVGYAIKKQSKRYEREMNTSRDTLERFWKIVMSMLMTFMKFMPYAVMSMVTVAIIGGPIAHLVDIGKVMGTAYIGLFISLVWHTLTILFFGINPVQWWKFAWKPVIQGFATQSFQATIPISIDALKDDMKIKEEAVNLVLPLSSTMGLTGCAGVQAGVVLMFVYNGASSINSQYSVWIWFLMGLIVTVITSLGIAGVPGTAPLVTAGVLSGLGFPTYYGTVYTYLGALDGILDMGRTAVNVAGGLQATTIVARMQNKITEPQMILFNYRKKNRQKNKNKIH